MQNKTDKKELFSQGDIGVVCPEKMVWDEMAVVGEGRRLCEGCDKVLVDVTGYTKEEVYELQKKDPSICVAVTNALLISSLSFSLLSAKEVNTSIPTEMNITDDVIFNETVVGVVEMPVPIKPPPIIVMLGSPVSPICSGGMEELDIVGFEDSLVCIEKDEEE